MNLDESEMLSVNGGGISVGVIAAISTAVVYLIGVLSGYTNPNKCNNTRR